MSKLLNTKLIEANEKLREKKHITSLVSTAKNDLLQKVKEFESLSRILQQEKNDVEKLEGLSLHNMFYNVLGAKEEKLKKEQSEFLAAKLKFDSCKGSIKSLDDDIFSLNKRLSELKDAESNYTNLLREKEKLAGDKYNDKLARFYEQESDYKIDIKEIEEAVSAGEKVLVKLDEVLTILKSAKNWGTFDLLGGGLIATAVKHSKMNEAKSAINSVQRLLLKFHQELSDINVTTGSTIDIDLSSFTKFADYFFDGLIVDWIVQSKIKNSYNSSINLHNDISKLLKILNNELGSTAQKLIKLEIDKNKYLETL